MSDDPLRTPWERSRDARHAERAARRRERHADRDARKAEKKGEPSRGGASPEAIVAAALRILDSEGLGALTIRRLASELDMGVMTLYWYIANKDELLDLVAERVASEIPTPPPGATWQDRLRLMGSGMRQTLIRHPGAVPVLAARPALGPSALGLMESVLAILREAGFGPQDAADGYFTLSNYIVGFCAWETAGGRPRRAEDTAEVRAYIASLPADRFPTLTALAPRIFAGSLDERFAFGLDCLLEGFAARLAASAADPAS